MLNVDHLGCVDSAFKRIQKQISDPRFAGFRGRKEREIRNLIRDLGNLSQTRAVCMTAWASQEMPCLIMRLYRAEFCGRQFE